MKALSFKGYRFPLDVIRYAVWLYFRFSLSLRDVEELLAQRGIDVSYETIRCWTIRFGPLIARRLRKLRPKPSPRWHLDEMISIMGGRKMLLWRAVDDEGEVLDLVVQIRRDRRAAWILLEKLLRNHPVQPEAIVTDGLASYSAALTDLAGCGRTTGLKTRIYPFDDASGRCRGSRVLAPPNASSQPTPRSTTPSTPSDT